MFDDIPTFPNHEAEAEYLRALLKDVLTRIHDLIDKNLISDAEITFYIEGFKMMEELLAKRTTDLNKRSQNQYVGPSYQNQHVGPPQQDQVVAPSHQDQIDGVSHQLVVSSPQELAVTLAQEPGGATVTVKTRTSSPQELDVTLAQEVGTTTITVKTRTR
ncbi:hypothetical protein Tco_0559797 [Tanacetum coccineum]